ncbi:MAG TPA: asparagine synthase-related protein [Gelidibacter sp.]|uniref:asparagine synthase-related protein n=1 Tax=Gelidibacter sp. TaxID=2018083 RepID=UPI002BCFB296|nr:asparagine synthase-related protein [Gelidibacter sp.]HXK00001.1 asparagine synthase-related protein [Gelidibacter sp.]
MKQIKTSVIPTNQTYVKVRAPHELDKKAICIFAATSYFLGTDTYWKDEKVLPPGTINTIDDKGNWVDSQPWFKWHYSPRDISFDQAVNEFTELFHTICKEQASNDTVLLPLSGGLDSRTQAVAYSKLGNPVLSYSYSFHNGYKEGIIAKKIAEVLGYKYNDMTIREGYLWDKVDQLAKLLNYGTEFTHARQMAVIEEFRKMDGVFTLGHWGDVLFDSPAPKDLTEENVEEWLLKKIIVKGGQELAEALWKEWEIEGEFMPYLKQRIKEVWDTIPIENVSAKARAYLSSTRAVRWTNLGFAIFEATNPVQAPYYDDRMAAFICGINEEYLADRKIQIAYLKNESPEVAKIIWQAQKPYNLYTFQKNKSPYNLPYQIVDKVKRVINGKLGKPFIQRNWELQFLGMENDEKLQEHLFGENLHPFLPKELLARFYNNFKTKNMVEYSHPLSMLLALAVWYKNEVK